MANGEIRPLTESKPLHWLIWNCEYMIDYVLEICPHINFCKISSTGASIESGEMYNI